MVYKLKHIYKKLFCEWCRHTDTYDVTIHNQPKCKKCFRFIPKNPKPKRIVDYKPMRSKGVHPKANFRKKKK